MMFDGWLMGHCLLPASSPSFYICHDLFLYLQHQYSQYSGVSVSHFSIALLMLGCRILCLIDHYRSITTRCQLTRRTKLAGAVLLHSKFCLWRDRCRTPPSSTSNLFCTSAPSTSAFDRSRTPHSQLYPEFLQAYPEATREATKEVGSGRRISPQFSYLVPVLTR